MEACTENQFFEFIEEINPRESRSYGDYKDTLTGITKTWETCSTFSRIVDSIGGRGFGDFKKGDIVFVLYTEQKLLLLFLSPQCFLYLLNQVFPAVWHCAVFHNLAIAWARYQINLLPVSVAAELLAYAHSYFCPKNDSEGGYHYLVKDRDCFAGEKETAWMPQNNGVFLVIEVTEENRRFLGTLSCLIQKSIDFKVLFAAEKKKGLIEQYKENLSMYSPSEDERFLGFQSFQTAIKYYFGSVPNIEGFPLQFDEQGNLVSGYSDIRLPKGESLSESFDSREPDKMTIGKFALETKQNGETWDRVSEMIGERFGITMGRDSATNWAKAYWESTTQTSPCQSLSEDALQKKTNRLPAVISPVFRGFFMRRFNSENPIFRFRLSHLFLCRKFKIIDYRGIPSHANEIPYTSPKRQEKTIYLGRKFTERTATDLTNIVEKLLFCQANSTDLTEGQLFGWRRHRRKSNGSCPTSD